MNTIQAERTLPFFFYGLSFALLGAACSSKEGGGDAGRDKAVPTTLASRFEKVGGDAAARASCRCARRGSAK
ncbi:MAG: hypothetical protein ACRD00_00780 [Thermoanaerobaculia bacterium]